MATIFWIGCPKCEKKFYAVEEEFKGQDRKMMCPHCGERFLDKDGKEVTGNE